MNEKYIKQFEENLKECKSIVGSLSMINAYTIGISQNLLFDDALDIINFYDWFFKEYEDNEKVFEEIYDNWGEEGPRIFRLANYFIEMKNEAYLFDLYENYDNNIKNCIDSLYNFILNIRETRLLTFSYNKQEIGDDYLDIPKVIRKNDLDDYKKELKLLIIKFVDLGGSFVLRIKKNKEDEIYGFLSSDNKIEKISETKLKVIYMKNPYKNKKSEIYREADINFN